MSINCKKDFEKQNKHFGLLLSVLFLIFAIYLIVIKSTFVGHLFAILSGIVLLVSIFRPRALNQITKIWLRFGDILGQVISPITLGIIFFLLITPVGLITKIFSRDELLLKKRNVKSYWLHRDTNADQSNSFQRQF